MVLGKLIFQNLQKFGFPYPIDKSVCTSWAKDIPKGGETIIYTSCMYQTASLSDIFSKFIPYAEKLSSLSALAKLVKPSKEEIDRAYRILQNISLMLKRRGVQFGYLYESEPYSGAILLELGYLDEFAEYAKIVTDFFKQKGIKRIITVDPHTHNALLRYKEFTNFDVDVVSYFELLGNVKARMQGEIVVHDSCLYSRFLGKREVYRSLLNSSGLKLVEDELVTGKDTSYCCGGPIKPVNRELSEKIARLRVEQLKRLSENIVVVCPMCYANLSKYHKILDFAEVVE